MTHLPTGIVVKSQATRSKSENYNIARRILAEKVELLEKGDESRVTKKAEKAAKKKASADKKKRRKYRKLSEEKTGNEGDDRNDDDVASENDDVDPGQDTGR
jgi:peptide chain release factor